MLECIAYFTLNTELTVLANLTHIILTRVANLTRGTLSRVTNLAAYTKLASSTLVSIASRLARVTGLARWTLACIASRLANIAGLTCRTDCGVAELASITRLTGWAAHYGSTPP